MSFIVMGLDECGSEFRPSSAKHLDDDGAYAELSELREQYPEARSLWVEELRDKAYYQMQREQADYERDWWDDYDY